MHLPPPTEEDVEYLLAGIQVQLIQVTFIKPSIEIHMWDHTPIQSKKRALRRNTFLLPRFLITFDRIDTNIQLPMEKMLAPTISQLREIPTRLEKTPFNRVEFEIGEIEAILDFSGQKFNICRLQKVTGRVKMLIEPHLWQDRVKLNADLVIHSVEMNFNSAQMCLVIYILQSMTNRRLIDVLYTNLLVDISNQQLVSLKFLWEKVILGFDKTDNYRILQLEINKLNGFACIPVLKTQTHVIQWPTNGKAVTKKASDFVSILYQLPLHDGATSCPPIIDVRIEKGGICLDSLVCRFLNYEIKRWNFPIYEGQLASSKSDTAIVLDTPVKKKANIETKIPPAIPSVHSSSDRDANTSMIVEADESTEDKHVLSNLFQLAKHLVVQIDVGETVLYFPTKIMKCSIFNSSEVRENHALHENDCLVIGLPGITIMSSVGQLEISSHELPIKLAPKHWTFGRLSFPWTIQLTDTKIGTVQSEAQFNFLQPNTMNIIISVNDTDQFSMDLHVDMKPVRVNFILDQMNFILKSIRHFLSLKFLKNLMEGKRKQHLPSICFSGHPSDESSKEIKEFLSYTQASTVHSLKSSKFKHKTKSKSF